MTQLRNPSMVNQTTFGRRTTSSHPIARATEAHDPIRPAGNHARSEQAAERSSALLMHTASPPTDDEFREWKKARKRHSGLPWRQLALMASVCFGVASLVLPDSVSDTLDWVLYGLMAASAYAGLSRRWSMTSKN
jgi:hypothetical protein